MNIKNKITYLTKKYKTNDPYELADILNITIFFEDLGSINGYYNKILRMRQIHINCNLEKHVKRFTCAHELGHALLHTNASTPFLRAHTFFSIDRLELEANTFAINLLLPDEIIAEHSNLTIEQFSRLTGYHQKLIELRLK